jgi:hypothetical protein
MKVVIDLDLPEEVVSKLRDIAEAENKSRPKLLRQWAVRFIDAELAKRRAEEPTIDDPEFARVRDLIGARSLKWLAEHEYKGVSVRDLAELDGVAKSTIHDGITRARHTLARHGLWPAAR